MKGLVKVFRRPLYGMVSGLIIVTLSVTILLWSNMSLLWSFWTNESISASQTLALAWQLLVGAPSNMGGLAVTLVLINSTLLGIITSMIWYAWRIKKRQSINKRLLGATSGGMLAALLGIGCIACGPLLLGSIFSLVGAGGILLLLPLHGAELGVIAFFLLLYALYSVQKVITAPLVCEIK